MAIDIDQLPKAYKKQALAKIAASEQLPAQKEQRSKYGNVKTTVDGIRFDSRAEARRYEELKLLYKSGQISGFMRQVSIPLHVDRYIADFLVVELDGTFWLEDVKGYETDTFKKKKKEIEKLYPWLDFRVRKV
ncbi:MAG: DUF1064 domain-containing protein [Eubacteriales bacterium]|nr:DUF1064 domain-containing protein [Eubacteriales bacterium]